MALNKSKSFSYWKIIDIRANKLALNLSVELGAFVDQTEADSGQDPTFRKAFYFNVTSEQMDGDLLALGYTLIKAMDPQDTDLSGATDC